MPDDAGYCVRPVPPHHCRRCGRDRPTYRDVCEGQEIARCTVCSYVVARGKGPERPTFAIGVSWYELNYLASVFWLEMGD